VKASQPIRRELQRHWEKPSSILKANSCCWKKAVLKWCPRFTAHSESSKTFGLKQSSVFTTIPGVGCLWPDQPDGHRLLRAWAARAGYGSKKRRKRTKEHEVPVHSKGKKRSIFGLNARSCRQNPSAPLFPSFGKNRETLN
jgi:hypothetical protein